MVRIKPPSWGIKRVHPGPGGVRALNRENISSEDEAVRVARLKELKKFVQAVKLRPEDEAARRAWADFLHYQFLESGDYSDLIFDKDHDEDEPSIVKILRNLLFEDDIESLRKLFREDRRAAFEMTITAVDSNDFYYGVEVPLVNDVSILKMKVIIEESFSLRQINQVGSCCTLRVHANLLDKYIRRLSMNGLSMQCDVTIVFSMSFSKP